MLEKMDIVHEISVEDFLSLRQMVGFQKLQKTEAQRILENTSYIAVARLEGKTVGLVRLLFDYGTDAYITDVIVHPEYQGTGIGRLLVEDVLGYVKKNSCTGVRIACSLYANAGKEAFYEKLGFSRLPNDKYGYGMMLEI